MRIAADQTTEGQGSIMVNESRHRVVIVGGGFAGLTAAQALKRSPVMIHLLDRRNFHLFQPLLYQVATGGLSPANIAAPLRSIVRRQSNVLTLMEEVIGFDVPRQSVLTSHGSLPFDTLIVAAGVRHAYFGHPEWEVHAPGLKSVEDATGMRRRILLAFEQAETSHDDDDRQSCLTFVIVGGGPTGVELAGAIGELAHHTLKREFRQIRPGAARIMLFEAADRILSTYPPALSERATRSLQRLGVEVYVQTKVTDITRDSIQFHRDGQLHVLSTRTILWAAGVQASPLGQALAEATGAKLDRVGRVMVQPDLSVPNHANIFVLGDLAHCPGPDGQPLPGVAPVAMQQGSYVARLLNARLKGESIGPFHYHDRGSMATIGRGAAIADLGWIKLSGYLAWLAWLFIHLIFLVGFHNRMLVMFQWAWCYVTRNRSARLITDVPADVSSSNPSG